MATALLIFAGVVVIAYAVADKSKIPEYRARMNVWARPLCFFVLALLALLLFWR